ncbi:MAG: hypothetical protein WC640_01185 [Candidatus Paceibacterota bacterium]|jgi:hypothetical protein
MADDKEKKVVSGVSGLSVMIGLMILFAFWLTNNGPSGIKNQNNHNGLSKPVKEAPVKVAPVKSRNNSVSSQGQEESFSPYNGEVSLGSGTARSSYQPSQEYITLSASGNDLPIDIGGWTLKNGRDKQLLVVSGNTVRQASTAVKIPSIGIALYDPYHPQNNRRVPIALKSGDRAIITTGLGPVLDGLTIRDNFKINKCLGYLEDDNSYRAYPSLRSQCPSPDDVPGVSYLDNVCYDFVRSLRPCHTPKDVYVKDDGYCLDGNCKLSSYCQDFAQNNYNFNACFIRYSRDEDFVGAEWRIFLNQTWELWADRRETISLYDNKGLLVDEISY